VKRMLRINNWNNQTDYVPSSGCVAPMFAPENGTLSEGSPPWEVMYEKQDLGKMLRQSLHGTWMIAENVSAIEEDTSSRALEPEFRDLVQRWRRDTRHVSSITERSTHFAYQRIIGMGGDALPLILHDLETTHDHWIWALNAIVPLENPAQHTDVFEEAVDAWITWGREHAYI
jgi:hypothetical protein